MKKIISTILVAILVLSLCSCNFGHIEDTNGENDHTLCSLTEEDLLSGSNSFVQNVATKSRVGNKITYKVNKFSGVNTIANEYFSNEAELTIDTCFVLSQGNARIAVIVNGEISCDIPVGESTTTIAVPADTSVVIRLAGESAGFDLSIELN